MNLLHTLFNKHVIYTTLIVYGLMLLGYAISIDFKILNPFKKALKDYDVTDLVFAKFKDINTALDDRIVLVNIGKPDRNEISQVLEKIKSYKPAIIGIDIHFEEFNQTSTDTLLRNTLMSNSDIVSVMKLGGYDAVESKYNQLEGCNGFFCDSIRVAYSNFYASLGKTIRRFSPSEYIGNKKYNAFGTALAIAYDPEVESFLDKRNYECEIINYRGDGDTYITVDKSMLLGKDVNLEETFKDKIVMIGYLGSDEWVESIKDKFFTPLNNKIASKSLPDMYGLIIHANIVSMLLDRDMIGVLPHYLSEALNILLIFLVVHLFRRVYKNIGSGYWRIIKIMQLVLFALLFLIISMIMYFFNLKLELALGVVGAVISWDVIKFYENVIRKKQPFFNPSKPKS